MHEMPTPASIVDKEDVIAEAGLSVPETDEMRVAVAAQLLHTQPGAEGAAPGCAGPGTYAGQPEDGL